MNRKILLITILSSALLLTSCGNKNEISSKDNTAKTKTETSTKSANTENPTSNTDENTNEDVEAAKITSNKADKEVLKNLIDNSDYVSRIKIQATQDNSTNVNFIEDYRGDLSGIELELPKTLKSNKEYIVFYTDGVDGDVTPSRGDESFIEIQGDNDASLNYVEKYFNVGVDSQ